MMAKNGGAADKLAAVFQIKGFRIWLEENSIPSNKYHLTALDIINYHKEVTEKVDNILKLLGDKG